MSNELNDKLDTIITARDNIKTSLENKGKTVTSDIRTYSNLVDSLVVLNGQTTSVNPSTVQQIIEPDNQHNGLTQVTVNAVTSAIDANIQTGNIKNGVTILGVTGTYEGSVSSNIIKYYVDSTSLNQVTGMQKGDYALVYDLEKLELNGNKGMKYLILPDTITLPKYDEMVSFSTGFGALEIGGSMTGADIGIWWEDMSGHSMSLYNITSSTADTNTYTRVQSASYLQELPYGWTFNPDGSEDVSDFLAAVKGSNFTFTGLYYYNGSSWALLPNQLTSSAQYVLAGRTAYTSEGLVTGTFNLANQIYFYGFTANDWADEQTRYTRNQLLYFPKSVVGQGTQYSIGDYNWCYIGNQLYIGEDLALYDNFNNAYFELYGTGTITKVINNNGTPVVTTITPSSGNQKENCYWIADAEHTMENSATIATNLKIGALDSSTGQPIANLTLLPALNRAADIPVGKSYISIDGQTISGTYVAPSMT